uniref:Uncharacterized protein n=1 Tax=Cyprinus carpio TaxID=7962 RepID=A0A8C1PNC7_CYPCA
MIFSKCRHQCLSAVSQLISAQVRELLGVSEPRWNQSIAEPLHDDRTVFLQMKSRTGQQADSLTHESLPSRLHKGVFCDEPLESLPTLLLRRLAT